MLPEEILKAQPKPDRGKRVTELQVIKSQAEQMSALVADPNWEMYGRFLEPLRDAYAVSMTHQQAILADPMGFLSSEDYARKKANLARTMGRHEAIKYALEIAKVIIEQGEKAAREIESLTKLED